MRGSAVGQGILPHVKQIWGNVLTFLWGLTLLRGDEQAYGTSWLVLPGTLRPWKNYCEAGSPGLSLIYADSFISSQTFIQPELLNQSKVSFIFTLGREEKWELYWRKLHREVTPPTPSFPCRLLTKWNPSFLSSCGPFSHQCFSEAIGVWKVHCWWEMTELIHFISI